MRYLNSLLRVAARARRSTAWALVLACAAAVLGGSTAGTATAGATATPSADLSGLARLPGHVNGNARPQFDLGRAPDSLAMHGLEVVFAKTASQQRAIEALIAAQQDPKSPQYHQFLTPAQYGARFGASEATVAAVSRWLTANGFTLEALPANRSELRFSGTKAQVETAFHTEIHLFEVDGVRHYANVENPAVPARARARRSRRSTACMTSTRRPTSSAGRRTWRARQAADHLRRRPENWVGPGDFAVMYNVGPLYNAGINGKNVTIAIVGESEIDSTVANTFWAGVGIATPPTITTVTVPAADGGTPVGQTMDNNEEEAYLDIEVAGGVAPGASIALDRRRQRRHRLPVRHRAEASARSSTSPSASARARSAAPQTPPIDTLFAEAAAQGQTVVVASDDAGVAGCEQNLFTQGTLATTGFAVSGLASSPHVLSVGGTDFDPTQPQSWATQQRAGNARQRAGAHPRDGVERHLRQSRLRQSLSRRPRSRSATWHSSTARRIIFLRSQAAAAASAAASRVDTTTNACTGGYCRCRAGSQGSPGFPRISAGARCRT